MCHTNSSELAVILVSQICLQTFQVVPSPYVQAWMHRRNVLLKLCQLISNGQILFTGGQDQRGPAFGSVLQNSEFRHFLEAKNSQMNIQT